VARIDGGDTVWPLQLRNLIPHPADDVLFPTPDGQRFLLIRADQKSPAGIEQMNIVQNWTEELKQRVPTR
jgi:hypothetical protein